MRLDELEWRSAVNDFATARLQVGHQLYTIFRNRDGTYCVWQSGYALWSFIDTLTAECVLIHLSNKENHQP